MRAIGVRPPPTERRNGYEALVVLPRVSSRRIVVIVFSIAPRLIIRVPRFIIPSAARYAPFAVL